MVAPEDFTTGEVIPPRGLLDVTIPVRPRSGLRKRTKAGPLEDQPAPKKTKATFAQTQAPLSQSVRMAVQESGNAFLTFAQVMQGFAEGLANQTPNEPARVAEVEHKFANIEGELRKMKEQ